MKSFKKIITLFLFVAALFCFDANVLKAQSYEAGSKVLNLGIGVGGRHTLGFGVSGSFEIGIWETGDFGVIGLGAMTGFRVASDVLLLDDVTYTEFAVAPRGTYHFTIIPVENLDVYAAIQIVFDFETINYKSDLISDSNSLVIFPAAVAGVRYYFSDAFGIFGEVGYNLNYLTGGIALKF